MKTISKKTKLTILLACVIIILASLIFLYQYIFYESPENWNNITWQSKNNKFSDLEPKWQIKVPMDWKVKRINCCENSGISFTGWSSNLTSSYLNNTQSVYGLMQVSLSRIVNPKDKDGNFVGLNIYHRNSCLKEQPECSDLYNIENIISSLEKNKNYQKEYQKNKVIFKEIKENFINQKPNKIYHDADGIISTDKSGTAFVFENNNYFEFKLYFDTQTDLNQIYNNFSYMIDSFEIME